MKNKQTDTLVNNDKRKLFVKIKIIQIILSHNIKRTIQSNDPIVQLEEPFFKHYTNDLI